MHGPRFVDSLKNLGHSHPSFSRKVRDATSNDPWGPTGSELNEIAKGSFEIRNLGPLVKVIAKRLNSMDSRRWRKILKTLTLVLFVTQVGASEFVDWCRVNKHMFTKFHSFQMVVPNDSRNSAKDLQEQAKLIRTKADSIVMLLNDKDLLQRKRTSFHRLRSDMSQPGDLQDEAEEVDIDEVEEVDMFPMRHTRSLDLNRAEIFGKFDESNAGFSSDDSTEESPSKTRRRQLSILVEEESDEISRSRKNSVNTDSSGGLLRTSTMPTRRPHRFSDKNPFTVAVQAQSPVIN